MSRYILKDRKIIENCMAEISTSLGMEVVIQKPKRSKPQNSLYWSLLKVFADNNGDTDDDWHLFFAVRFIGVERKTIDGESLVFPISTTSLNTKEFTLYLDKIYMFGEALGLRLPTPAHYGYEEQND